MSTLEQPYPPADNSTPRRPASPSPPPSAAHSRGPSQQPVESPREAARAAVLGSLTRSGAVILGAPGIGKTTLARDAVSRFSGGYAVQLRGSALSRETPYGALAWLLSGFSAEELAGPVQVVQALEVLLSRQAAGRRIVLVVDNAEDLDELAVVVTTQLCRRGTAALLLVARDLVRCHREYVRLWTDGALTRVDLAPLDLAQTGELLEETAGAPLTNLARQVLWDRSRGNPLVATLLCRDHIAAGSLVQCRGFWAWTGPPVHAGELPERIETLLRRFSAEARRAVEILALSRELPLQTLVQLVPARVVDAMEESSMVTVGGDHEQHVRLAGHLQAGTIAAVIPFGRSRDLWSEVRAVINLDTLTGPAAAGLAAWSLTCGIALDPGIALAAARWANEVGEADAALRFARALPAVGRPPAMSLAEADALTAEGQHAQAHRVLAAAGAGPDDGGPDMKRVRLRLLTCRAVAAALLPVRPEDPWALLEQAGRLVDADSDDLPGPALQVNLARADLLALEGRLAELPAALHDDYADPASPPVLRLWAGIRLAQQHAAAGRFDQALDMVSSVRTRLRAGISVGERTRERFFQELFFLLLRCGELGEALALTAAAEDPASGSGLRISTGSELPTGLVHGYAGQAAASLASLLPALAQLESRDPDDLLPVALWAAAYAGSLAADGENPAGPVPPPDFMRRPDPAVKSAADYFRILAAQATGDTADLYAFAQQAREAGDVPDALLGFAAAALRGHGSAAADLAAVAAAATGPAAEVYSLLAEGLLGDDVAALLRAGEAALRQQNSWLAYSSARKAHALAAGGSSRSSVRRARHLEYECFRLLAPENTVEHGLAQLGDFERELALLAAAGETSVALGERFHLSARTVDWHLGRVFARLHVSGRTDLRQVLSGSSRTGSPWSATT